MATLYLNLPCHPGQPHEEGGLATAAPPTDGHLLPGGDGEIEASWGTVNITHCHTVTIHDMSCHTVSQFRTYISIITQSVTEIIIPIENVK